ncbi:MAG TPA: hypothetical protein VLT79_02885 [Gemmatimonadales bacterium]|nr:hypothetical protein [Gemmatimonadales bacterium]
MRFLAPPAPVSNPDGGQGRAIFTDLLLHDMGPELDDMCLGLATTSRMPLPSNRRDPGA